VGLGFRDRWRATETAKWPRLVAGRIRGARAILGNPQGRSTLHQSVTLIGLSVAASLTGARAAWAQATWVGATTDYNTSSNWSTNTVPNTAGQSAIFSNTGTTSVQVSTVVNPDSWIFQNNAQSYIVSGTDVTFGTATGIINQANTGQALWIINNIGGAGAQVQQLGASILRLSGSNTYSGGTTINAGTLAIFADNNLGSSLGGLSFVAER
jgi:autotransporter-associated beta strand protein